MGFHKIFIPRIRFSHFNPDKSKIWEIHFWKLVSHDIPREHIPKLTEVDRYKIEKDIKHKIIQLTNIKCHLNKLTLNPIH